MIQTRFLVPYFNKAEKDKVSDRVDVPYPQVLARNSLNTATTAPAISSQGFAANSDGTYVFVTRVDDRRDACCATIGFTSTATQDSGARNVCPGAGKMSGVCLSMFLGQTISGDGDDATGRVENYLASVTTKAAKEIVSILTISINGGKRTVQFIVDGFEGPLKELRKLDFENVNGGSFIFPVVSLGRVPDRVTMIPFNEIQSRSLTITALMREFDEQQQQQQKRTAPPPLVTSPFVNTAGMQQLQQELEKERQRANTAEVQVLNERKLANQYKQQLAAETANVLSLSTQLEQKDQLILQLQQENKKLQQEIATLKADPDQGATSNLPAPRCFDMPISSLPDVKECVRLMLSLREVPPGRPDLQQHIPTDQNLKNTLAALDFQVNSIKKRDKVKKLIADCGLTDDNIRALYVYGAEHPYAVYRWLNGWLTGSRRDDKVKQAVGPFFNQLYRAMEKLPKIKSRAARAVKVQNIASLAATYDNYMTRLASGENLSFWGISSFSTNDEVINDPMFCGAPHEEGIIYMCGELVGVDMEPFKPDGLEGEAEILPMCPAVFEVQSAVKSGKKLIVSLKQTGHDVFSYVEPLEENSF